MFWATAIGYVGNTFLLPAPGGHPLDDAGGEDRRLQILCPDLTERLFEVSS